MRLSDDSNNDGMCFNISEMFRKRLFEGQLLIFLEAFVFFIVQLQLSPFSPITLPVLQTLPPTFNTPLNQLSLSMGPL